MLPFFGCLVLIAVVMNLLQTGIVFLPEKLAPDLKRVDPIKGLGRMFSLPSVMRLVFGLFKIAIVCAVALVSLYAEWPEIMALGGQPVATIAVFTTQVLLWTAIKIAVVLLILALCGLCVSVVEARARSEDDDAGSPRGDEEPARRPADRRPTSQRAAPARPQPTRHGGAQGRRRRDQPDRAGHRDPVRPRNDGGAQSLSPRAPV